MKRGAKVVLAVASGAVAIVVLAAFNLAGIVRYATTPAVPFAEQAPPPAPDYTNPASWSALPEREDAGDGVVDDYPVRDQTRALADVFYVHPTTYIGARWNAPVDDPQLNADTDRVATLIQASAFNDCCAVYAPRYRQAGPTPWIAPSPDGQLAIDLAFEDVRRAFSEFQARRGPGRPFFLASHSQGSIVAERLLREEISGKPARDQLVAAYLIGGTATVEGLRETVPDIPPCVTPFDTHCVVSWNARAEGFVEGGGFEIERTDTRERLCTNPLSWVPDGAHMSADENMGAVFLETDDRSVRPTFADAQCVDGALVVRQLRPPPRDLPSKILDHVLGAGNYHAFEYQIFFMNIRQNARARMSSL